MQIRVSQFMNLDLEFANIIIYLPGEEEEQAGEEQGPHGDRLRPLPQVELPRGPRGRLRSL